MDLVTFTEASLNGKSVTKIRNYDENLLKIEFAWSKSSLSQADIVSSASCLIHKDMVRESIDKMKN